MRREAASCVLHPTCCKCWIWFFLLCAAGTNSVQCLEESKGATVQTASAKLNDGTTIPLVGLGVYQTEPGPQAFQAVLAALQYRLPRQPR